MQCLNQEREGYIESKNSETSILGFSGVTELIEWVFHSPWELWRDMFVSFQTPTL